MIISRLFFYVEELGIIDFYVMTGLTTYLDMESENNTRTLDQNVLGSVVIQ